MSKKILSCKRKIQKNKTGKESYSYKVTIPQSYLEFVDIDTEVNLILDTDSKRIYIEKI